MRKKREDAKEKQGTVLAKIRNLPGFDELWIGAFIKGRPSCPKKHVAGSPFLGSNILVGYGDEIVIISERGGRAKVHDFERSIAGTFLGNKVRRIIEEAKLPMD